MNDLHFVGCANAESMNKALEDKRGYFPPNLYSGGTRDSVLWEGVRKSSSL